MRSPLDFPLLIFSAISALSLVVAVNVYEGLGGLYQQSIFIALYFVVSSNILDEAQIRWLLKFLVGAGVVVTIYGLIQVAGADPFSFSSGRGPISTLGNRNYVADLLVTTLPLALGLFLTCRRRIWKILYALVVMAMAFLIGWTLSKGATISMAIAIFAFMFLTIVYRRGRMVDRVAKMALVIVVALSLFLVVIVPFFYSSGPSSADLRDDPFAGSALKRIYIYRAALGMIADRPLIGVGVGNWGVLHPNYRIPELTNRLRYEQTHNEYLEVGAETGLIGLVFYLAIFFLAAWILWKSLRSEEDADRYRITTGLAAAFIGASVSALFSFNLQNPASGMAFWIILGLIGRRGSISLPPFPSWARPFTSAGGEVSISLSRKWGGVVLATAFILTSTIYLETVWALRADGYFQQGGVYSDSGDWGDAVSMYENSIRLKPNDFEVHFHLARAYRELKDYPSAEESYRRSLGLRPYFEKAYNNLGDVYVRMGRYQQAVEEFKNALDIYPTYLTSIGNLGVAYELMGRYPESVSQYERLLQLFPDHIGFHRRVARIYNTELNDESKARYHLEMFIKKKSKGSEADEVRGELKRMGTN